MTIGVRFITGPIVMTGFRLSGRVFALAAFTAVSLMPALAIAAPSYTLQSFGPSGQQAPIGFEDINASGTIVGQTGDWLSPWATWAGGEVTELVDSGKATTAFINAAGDVAAGVVSA